MCGLAYLSGEMSDGLRIFLFRLRHIELGVISVFVFYYPKKYCGLQRTLSMLLGMCWLPAKIRVEMKMHDSINYVKTIKKS